MENTTCSNRREKSTVGFRARITARPRPVVAVHRTFQQLQLLSTHFDPVLHFLLVDDKLGLHLEKIFVVFQLVAGQTVPQIAVDLIATAIDAFLQKQRVVVLFRKVVAFRNKSRLKY